MDLLRRSSGSAAPNGVAASKNGTNKGSGERPKKIKKRRRPWGKDKKAGSSPIVPQPVSRAKLSGARFALFFTFIAWLAYLIEQAVRANRVGLTPITFIETTVYLFFVTLLTASAAAYLLARIGYFERINKHRRVPRSTIDNQFDQNQPSLTVLVPSYREEERIIRLTLLSAALQDYPDLRVVLLIDDPPHSLDPEHQETLARARALIAELAAYLAEPRREFGEAFAAFEQKTPQDIISDRQILQTLASTYGRAANWFEEEIAAAVCMDHIDEFFVLEFLEPMARDLRATEEAVNTVAQDTTASISRRRVRQMYARLHHIFQAEFASFERKQFASLSHEPNKAMNLNSYIGLMGGSYRVVDSPGGQVLIPAGGRTIDITIRDSDYLLTLDADSILLPEYCLRLVYFMEQEENDDVAISQTPYSAYQGPLSRIERIAGATTDIQHIVHQGMTKYHATSWVGANAVIRKLALDELEETSEESGFTIRRYISDRTVIEDTESTITLREKGWRLYNYPERLSYSATPPDFGSLVIQRQRWANGGLVILPNLLRLLGRRQEGVPRLTFNELFLRTSYLASITWASVGLLMLLFYPFDGQLLSRIVVLTAVPYWWMMASDLKRAGYRRSDIFQIYGFNLLLLPVNLAGTIQSVIQAIGGQRTAFARTPKIRNHTVAPLIFIILPIVLLIWSARTLQRDIIEEAYIHGAFAALNLVTIAFALLAFLGIKNIIIDLFMNIREFIFRPVTEEVNEPEVPNWASVLYVGGSEAGIEKSGAPLAAALAAEDLYTNGGEGPAVTAGGNGLHVNNPVQIVVNENGNGHQAANGNGTNGAGSHAKPPSKVGVSGEYDST